jgi:DNA mismatch repair protein MutH
LVRETDEHEGATVALSYDPTDPASIEAWGKRLVGRTLREMLPEAADLAAVKGKGSFGEILENEYFCIHPGNKPAPDFPEAGVELKSTPVKRDSRGTLIPKERLVLGLINYTDIAEESWETSSFIHKNANLLIVFYRWVNGLSDLDYPIEAVRLWSFPEQDLEIIRDDWEAIASKVRAGRAHLLSEGDTQYLAAAVKGQRATDRRIQPYSEEPAKPRAYSLKASYMKAVVDEALARVTQEVSTLEQLRSGKTIEDIVTEHFRPYLGHSAEEIAQQLELLMDRSAKNYFAAITKRILGVAEKRRIAEFEKAGVIVKTMRLLPSGRPKEDISFPAFDYRELVAQNWEESDYYDQLTSRFFFVVYQLDSDGESKLVSTRFWTMPARDVEAYGQTCFEETVRRIKLGQTEALPKKSENPACHVRPHGRDSRDLVPTPTGGMAVRKSFWLNGQYVADQLRTRQGRV